MGTVAIELQRFKDGIFSSPILAFHIVLQQHTG